MTDNGEPTTPPIEHYPATVREPSKLWALALPIIIAGIIIAITVRSCSGPKTKTVAVAGPTSTVTATATATVQTTTTATVTTTPTKVIATRTATVRVTYTPPPVDQIGDGQYIVGRELTPGLYHTTGGDCYWERMKDLSGGFDSIIANDNITGPTTIEIAASDKAFKTSGGCKWSRIG
jgi:hypothetical protein